MLYAIIARDAPNSTTPPPFRTPKTPAATCKG